LPVKRLGRNGAADEALTTKVDNRYQLADALSPPVEVVCLGVGLRTQFSSKLDTQEITTLLFISAPALLRSRRLRLCAQNPFALV